MELAETYHFDIAALIHKFLVGTLTPEESARLDAWIAQSEDNQRLWQRMTDPVHLERELVKLKGADPVERERLMAEIAFRRLNGRRTMRKLLRYAAVVIPVVVLLGSAWYFWSGHSGRHADEALKSLEDVRIMPQGKVAQLVLANGKAIKLKGSTEKELTEQDGTQVSNQANALSYTAASGPGAPALYNTLITPRGGEYRVRLSDGTQVWLNAASSLRYPTRFTGSERSVYLAGGEAYFEVASDARHPFIVHVGGTKVKVLGTAFNVSSYEDDPRQEITLAEGAVYVTETGAAKKGVTLEPGYQAVVGGSAGLQVTEVNVEAVLAWKNGLFMFDNESLGSLMRKLSRWYDVEVVYEKGVDTLFHFTGRIKKYENITGILHLLEYTGKVTFEMKEHRLYVLPVTNVANTTASGKTVLSNVAFNP